MDPHHDRQRALQRDTEVHVQRDEDVEVEAVLADLWLDTLHKQRLNMYLKKNKETKKQKTFFMSCIPAFMLMSFLESKRVSQQHR